MPNSEAFSESIGALSRFFVGDATLQDTLQRVADLSCQAVPAADMVGITMLLDGRPSTAVFTDQTAVEADGSQYDAGEGPCLEAFRRRKTFRIEETEDDERWPSFARSAVDHGIHSSLSLPLVANGEGVGALNMYARRPKAFGPDDERLGGLFAAQAGIVLANAQAYWDAHELSQQLGEAMVSRATIEQAKGIIMAGRRCTADDAFQILVRASQRENCKLRDVAARIVAGVAEHQPTRVGTAT